MAPAALLGSRQLNDMLKALQQIIVNDTIAVANSATGAVIMSRLSS